MDTKQSIYLNKFIHKQKAQYFNNLSYSPKLCLLKISFNNHEMKYKLIKPELSSHLDALVTTDCEKSLGEEILSVREHPLNWSKGSNTSW